MIPSFRLNRRMGVAALLAVALLFAGAARAQEDAGSNPALSDAQARLATLMDALKNAKDEAQADATMVGKAKSELDVATVQFTDIKTKAAANPSDGRAAQALEAMSQALKDSRSALDAAMAKNAAADAKLKTLEAAAAAQKTAVDKLRAAAPQGAIAQPQSQPQPQPDDPKQAQAWFEASVAQAAKPGHFIALVSPPVQDGSTFSGFRYDRFAFDNAPSIERLVTEEGGFFARTGGKAWVESMNWGKSGDAVPAARAAELDAMVEKALRPLQPPDAQSGAVTWKPVADKPGIFEQVREKPAPGDAQAAPRFAFSEDPDEVAGTLLRSVATDWNWEGKPAKVTVDYFYLPQENPLSQGGPQPEEEIAAALRDAMSKPLRVDVITTRRKTPPPAAGGSSAVGTLELKMERVRVAGIISGKDFDLTEMKDGAFVSRQIAVGNDAWTSADGGKTWRKQAAADRTYYDVALASVVNGSPVWALLMMMSTPPQGPAGGPPVTDRTMAAGFAASDAAPGDAPSGGEALRKLTLKFQKEPPASMPEILTYWLAMREGRPVLRRITGMAVTAKSKFPMTGRTAFADYGDVADGTGVLPPPGNPAAVPAPRGEDLLALAVKAMEGRPWHVVMTTAQQNQTGKDTWSDPQPLGRTEGVFSGKDFDLSGDMMKEHKWSIGVGEKVWTSGTIAGVWTEAARFQLGAQADGDYQSVHAPLDGQFTAGIYDIAGKEQHEGETWLHLKKSPASGLIFMSAIDYWLLLDKEGKPAAVRRCIWTAGEGMLMAMRVSRNLDQADYTPARPGEQIKPPAGE